MASIKIPYFYKKYENSKLATLADKTVQSGDLAWILMVFMYSLAISVIIPVYNLFRGNDSVGIVMGLLALVLILVLPIAAPMIFRRIWNTKGLNDKLALLDIRRRQDPVLNRKFIITSVLLVVVYLLPIISAVVIILKSVK